MIKVWMKLLELFEESTITQSILVLMVFGAIVYCVVSKQEIPDVLTYFAGIIIGFFFGAKSTIAVRKGVERWKSQ